MRGAILALRRLGRCHPWGGSGYDPVPPGTGVARAAAQGAERTGRLTARHTGDEMDQRNLLLAIVLSVVILIGFQFVFERLRPPLPRRPKRQAGDDVDRDDLRRRAATAGLRRQPPARPAGPPRNHAKRRLTEQPRVKIDTPRVHGSIAIMGGALRRRDARQLSRDRGPEQPGGGAVLTLGHAGGLFRRIRLGGARRLRHARSRMYTDGQTRMDRRKRHADARAPGDPDLGQRPGPHLHAHDQRRRGLHVHRRESVEQHRDKPVNCCRMGSISRSGTPPDTGYYILFEGPMGVFNGTPHEVKYSVTSKSRSNTHSTGGWIGITDKYWLTSLVPTRTRRSRRASFIRSTAGRPLSGRLYLGPRAHGGRRRHGKPSSSFSPAPRKPSSLKPIAPPASRCSITRSISAGSGS